MILIEWDAASCSSHDYNILWGMLGDVASYDMREAGCSVGLDGSYIWSEVPPEHSIYFLVVGTDDTGVYESSWGRDSAGGERNELSASFECGATTKILSATCE